MKLGKNSWLAAVAVVLLGVGAVLSRPACAATPKDGKLRVWFIDVEGGQATLFVTPEGQSLLIDTGWPGNEGRDAARIVAAAHEAGLTKIDQVLITHYHMDHVGGVPQLVKRIPVGMFIDHGPLRELGPDTEGIYADYRKVLASGESKELTPAPGDKLPVVGMKVTVVQTDGHPILQPLPGAGGSNSYCAASEIREADQTENSRSLGVMIEFGKLRILDLGDLTWDKERALMCPANRLGRVDVLIVSHHGWMQSSSPALVDGVHPQVAIMDNGAKKGGSLPTLNTVRQIPGLEALWQLHYSEEGGSAANTAAPYIANLTDTPDAGYMIRLEANPDGSYTVQNGRTREKKSYSLRK
jgi:beta-lactamase superfamily II metal-dependent hydrolase